MIKVLFVKFYKTIKGDSVCLFVCFSFEMLNVKKWNMVLWYCQRLSNTKSCFLFLRKKQKKKLFLEQNTKVSKLFNIFCFVCFKSEKKIEKKDFSELQTERAFNRDYSRPGKKEGNLKWIINCWTIFEKHFLKSKYLPNFCSIFLIG